MFIIQKNKVIMSFDNQKRWSPTYFKKNNPVLAKIDKPYVIVIDSPCYKMINQVLNICVCFLAL